MVKRQHHRIVLRHSGLAMLECHFKFRPLKDASSCSSLEIDGEKGAESVRFVADATELICHSSKVRSTEIALKTTNSPYIVFVSVIVRDISQLLLLKFRCVCATCAKFDASSGRVVQFQNSIR